MRKSKLKKVISASLITTGITAVLPVNAHAEWKRIDDNHYGYLENNKLCKGWKKLNYTCLYDIDDSSKDDSRKKAWYYFDKNGIMQTDTWIKSDDKWHYLEPNGAMAKDCIVEGYALGPDGAWIQGAGWRQFEYYGKYSRRSEDVNVHDDYTNKAWYYFDENGVMKTNSWIKTGGKWYYVRDDGSMAKNCFIDGYPINMFGEWISDGGWKKDDKGWWFSYGSGKGYAIEWKTLDDPFYCPNDYQNMIDGKIKYYFGRDGYMKTGWIQYEGKWYYLNDDGTMASNTSVNGYVIGEDGAWIERIGQLNYTEDLVTVPEKSVYPLGTKTIKFDVINNTGKVYEAYYGSGFPEKYENNQWVSMKYKQDDKPIDIYAVEPSVMPPSIYIKKIYSNEVDLTNYEDFDSSKPGKYRIRFGDSYSTHRFLEFELK